MDRVAESRPRWRILVSLDVCIAFVSYLGLLYWRFDGQIPHDWWTRFWGFIPWAALLAVLMNTAFGLYTRERRASRALLAGLVIAIVLTSVGAGGGTVPLSVAALGGIVSALGFGAARLAVR